MMELDGGECCVTWVIMFNIFMVSSFWTASIKYHMMSQVILLCAGSGSHCLLIIVNIKLLTSFRYFISPLILLFTQIIVCSTKIYKHSVIKIFCAQKFELAVLRVGKATKSSQKGPIPNHKAKEASSYI